MVQRWLKTVVVLSASAMLFSACQKSVYSEDPPLDPKHSPSVFIGSRNEYLYALVPETGEKKWEAHIGANMIASPVVMKDYLMVASADSLYKLDVHTGKILKAYSFDNENLVSFIGTPYYQGDIIYVVSNNGFLYAINISNDQLVWKYDAGSPILSSPTLYNGVLIVTASAEVKAVNVLNGTPAWSAAIPSTGGAAVASPYIYVAGTDGKLHALDITTGVQSWEYDPGTPSARIESSPVVYGGNIIFGSNDFNIYCIDSIAKKERWINFIGENILSSPYAKDQTVYFGCNDYYLYALDIIDGHVKWRKKTGAIIKSSPLVHQSTVYVGGFDKFMYAFDTSGTLRWSRNMDGQIETSPVLYDLEKAYYSSETGFH